MSVPSDDAVRLIEVERINILNPRDRNRKKFQEMVDSIARVGLKKPITVSRRSSRNGEENYNLVCGQGRLEAFKLLDQKSIPAIVVDLAKEECFLLSLVENLARRHHSPFELMKEIGNLAERGYSTQIIADKTGISGDYVRNLLRLLQNGEERLIAAVERNQIPVSIAIKIAETDDKDTQQALAEAYEHNELRGNRLQAARRIVQIRQQRGKKFISQPGSPRYRPISAKSIVRAYKQETERQRAMVAKADLTEHRLLFIVSALKELFNDANFVNLLRAEGLKTVPRQIVDLVSQQEAAE